MWKILAASFVSVTVFGAAFSATAQSSQPSEQELARVGADNNAGLKWQGKTPDFGWRWWTGSSGSVGVFPDPTDKGAPPGRPTRLRFVAMQIERSVNAPDRVQWIDGDKCPVLEERVRDFATLRAPMTVIPGLTWPPEFPVIILHGGRWTLWSDQAQQEGRFPARVTMSSSAGPIQDWIMASREALKTCWSEQEPAA